LDTVVEVGTLPYPDRLQLASRLILEPVCGVTGQDGLAIGLTTIDYDPLGSAVSPESLSQKPFGGGQVTFFAEPELDRIAVAVNGAVQISPLTTYLDIRLIHMPFPPDGPFALIETLEKLGGVTDHPAADSGVVNGDAALCHHFLQIPQAQAISKIPPYAQQDHRSIKLPALEHLCHSLSPAQAIARDRKERVATDRAHDLPLRGNHDPFRIDPEADRPVGEGRRHAVAVALQMDEAGRRDPLGVFDEAVEEAWHRHQEPRFLGPDVFDRSGSETMGNLLPQLPAPPLQPVVQGLQRWKARHRLP